MALNAAAVHFAVLDTRRAYLLERIRVKQRMHWQTTHDEEERDALTWVLEFVMSSNVTGSVTRKLDLILTRLDAITLQETHQMATVTDVQAQLAALQTSVEAETTLSESVVTYVKGSNEMLASLKQQLADAIAAGGSDPAALQAVVDQLGAIQTTNEANAKKIADAIVANTPAEG
jgi:hypothetical protein